MKKKLLLIMLISLCIALTLTACGFFDSGSSDVKDEDSVLPPPYEEPAVEYTVKLVTNGGYVSFDLPEKMNSKTYYELPSASKTGYVFKGWYKNPDFTGEILTFIPEGNSTDLTLYACYRKLVTITYEANEGEHINKTQYAEGDTVTLSPAYKSGYIFCGWYLYPSFSGYKVEVLSDIKDDVTLYAYFCTAYPVTYNLQGGINNMQNPDAYCEEFSVQLYSPEKAGYNFEGWYDQNGNYVTEIAKGSKGGIVLTAKWSIAEYSLVWNLNGGYSAYPYPSSYTFGTGVPSSEFAFPKKNGMVFAGWYSTINGETVRLSEISEKMYGNLTISAKWETDVCLQSSNNWTYTGNTNSKQLTVKQDDDAFTVSVPDSLKWLYQQGKLGVKISATFYSNVRSQGNATATAYSSLLVNGQEYNASSISKKGGGYSYWDGFWTVPITGDWGYSGNKTVDVNLTLASDSLNIGYKYYLTSDKENDEIEFNMQFGCPEIVCSFYIVE